MVEFFTMYVTLGIIVIGPLLYLFYKKAKKYNAIEEVKYEILIGCAGVKCIFEDIYKSASNKIDLPQKSGHVVVITGGLRGIGLEVIRMLLECDMMVVVGCRKVEQGEHFANKMRMEGTTSGKLDFRTLDVSSMESVRKFAEAVKKDYPKIHVLINNAAIMYVPYAITPEGYESQFATNYLGHFLLTHLLLNQLVATGTEEEPARIIHISSVAHEIGKINFDDINYEKQYYVSYKCYSQSKLAQLLFGLYLNGILKERNYNVKSYVVHPGIVNTEIFNETLIKRVSPFVLGLMFKPPDKGAIPIVFCAVSPQAKDLDGCYISNCEKKETPVTKNSDQLLHNPSKSMFYSTKSKVLKWLLYFSKTYKIVSLLSRRWLWQLQSKTKTNRILAQIEINILTVPFCRCLQSFLYFNAVLIEGPVIGYPTNSVNFQFDLYNSMP